MASSSEKIHSSICKKLKAGILIKFRAAKYLRKYTAATVSLVNKFTVAI